MFDAGVLLVSVIDRVPIRLVGSSHFLRNLGADQLLDPALIRAFDVAELFDKQLEDAAELFHLGSSAGASAQAGSGAFFAFQSVRRILIAVFVSTR